MTRFRFDHRRWLALTGLPVALILTSVTACGPGNKFAASGFGSSAAVSASKKADFLAVRRYTSFSGPEIASYTEKFVQADDGRSRVELLMLNGDTPQTMTPEEYQQFQLMQKLLDGGRGRFVASGRDFAIRDAGRFLQNYTVNPLSATAVVAGRPCVVSEVNPKQSDRPHYLVWSDMETYVTLKYLEYLPTDALAAEMETIEVDFTYNAKKDAFPDLPITPPVDVSSTQFAGLVNFKSFVSSYIPSGFSLASVKLATIATHPVLTFSYTDGLQEIFVAQYAATGTPEIEPPNYPDNAPLHVHFDVLGGYVKTYFDVDGTTIHIEGKVEPEEVKSMIESLSPAGG